MVGNSIFNHSLFIIGLHYTNNNMVHPFHKIHRKKGTQLAKNIWTYFYFYRNIKDTV